MYGRSLGNVSMSNNSMLVDVRRVIAERCVLCDEATRKSIALSRLLAVPIEVVAESRNFVLIPDIRPIVPCHLLLITRQHHSSVARVPAELRRELKQFKERIQASLESKHEEFFWFEHGSGASPGSNSCCVRHAHLHFVPVRPIEVEEYLRRVSLSNALEEATGGIETLFTAKDDYIYFERRDGSCILVEKPLRPLPHQLARMLVARQEGTADWDWTRILFPTAHSEAT
jgi:diadenosine tetraphosphate (Ap4A) HIT family hydrolase